MALEEFYAAVDGNLAEVRGHLMTDERVTKFVKMFFDDPTYTQLADAMESGDMQTAFRGAHTLKGLALSMGFDQLNKKAADLTEALRPNDAGEPADPAAAPALFNDVRDEYEKITAAYQANF